MGELRWKEKQKSNYHQSDASELDILHTITCLNGCCYSFNPIHSLMPVAFCFALKNESIAGNSVAKQNDRVY